MSLSTAERGAKRKSAGLVDFGLPVLILNRKWSENYMFFAVMSLFMVETHHREEGYCKVIKLNNRKGCFSNKTTTNHSRLQTIASQSATDGRQALARSDEMNARG